MTTIPKRESWNIMQMSKAEALRIQAEHVAWYSRTYGPRVADLVAAATTADALPDGLHPVELINEHIPRGGAIEYLIPAKRDFEAALRAAERDKLAARLAEIDAALAAEAMAEE